MTYSVRCGSKLTSHDFCFAILPKYSSHTATPRLPSFTNPRLPLRYRITEYRRIFSMLSVHLQPRYQNSPGYGHRRPASPGNPSHKKHSHSCLMVQED